MTDAPPIPSAQHAENERGVKIKLQVSMRERPILPIRPMLQMALDYFKLLEFAPVAVPVSPSRKSSPRRSGLPHSAPKSETFTIFRKLQSAFLIATSSALWRCSNYGTAMAPISTMAGFASGSRVPGDYEVADLTTLLRRDQRPLLDQMIQRVVDGFRFLEDLTDLERNLAGDDGRRRRADAEALRDDVKGRVGAH